MPKSKNMFVDWTRNIMPIENDGRSSRRREYEEEWKGLAKQLLGTRRERRAMAREEAWREIQNG